MRGMFVLAFAGLAGCGPEAVTCDEYAAASVTVTVIDSYGGGVAGPVVTWTSDGSAAEPCEPIGNTFACGWEVAGDITVTASARGYDTVEQTVTVGMTDDECHVEGQLVTLTLNSVCDDPPPAMIVTVLTPDDEPAEGESVSFGRAGADAAPQACDEQSDGTWACGYGATGDLELYVQPASTDPFAAYFDTLTVNAGVCGPDTAFVTVNLVEG
jgi:hypothetical protein